MKKNEKLIFEWPGTGRLEVKVEKTDSAVLRYEPSSEVIQMMLEKYRADYNELEEEFRRLSEECRQHMREGHLTALSDVYMDMARVLEAEGKYKDELKTLMLSFYIDLSGIEREPYIRPGLPDMASNAFAESKIRKREMTELYLETVRKDCTPTHTMTVLGSLRLFNLCLLGKGENVEQMLKQALKE